MSASNFHVLPKVPDSVAHLDPEVVVEVLSRHAINVSDAVGELAWPAPTFAACCGPTRS